MPVDIKTVVDTEAENIYLELTGIGKKNVRREVKVFENNLIKQNDLLLANISKYVTERSTLTKKRIGELLDNDLRNLVGVFNQYKSDVLKQARFLSFNIQQQIYTDEIQTELGFDENTLYTWQAVFVNTCPSCIELHGTTKTKKAWDAEGGPKVFPTVCDGNCRCILIPTDVMPSRIENRKPILVEADRVRRTEIKRGKKYSPSYKSQIVGNLNNPEFRKTMRDLRKIKKVK